MALEFGDQFDCRTAGPDFVEEGTGTMIELTTPGQVAARPASGGECES